MTEWHAALHTMKQKEGGDPLLLDTKFVCRMARLPGNRWPIVNVTRPHVGMSSHPLIRLIRCDSHKLPFHRSCCDAAVP